MITKITGLEGPNSAVEEACPLNYLKKSIYGNLGNCGIFSFTESKVITTGEGGMLITDDESIAEVASLVRNHGEVLLKEDDVYPTMLGWNYRLTEIGAALGIVQFEKLDEFNEVRNSLASYLNQELSKIDGITTPVTTEGCTHNYWMYALKYDSDKIGIHRDKFAEALRAEGISFGAGYVEPLY